MWQGSDVRHLSSTPFTATAGAVPSAVLRSIVRDLVQLYGGDIRLGRSDLGGLRVHLGLPEFVQGSGH